MCIVFTLLGICRSAQQHHSSPSAVSSEALATVGQGQRQSSSVRADNRQAMHLDSLLLLPDTLLRSLHLQGTPKENQRLKRAWGARHRFNSDQPLTHLLLLLRQGGDRDKAIGWFNGGSLLTFVCSAVWLLFGGDTGDSWVTESTDQGSPLRSVKS